MRRSVDRILTTHVGSLPRSEELVELLVRIDAGEPVDGFAFRAQVARDLDHVALKQREVGIDIAGDGELPRIGFSSYVKDRMTGFGGVSTRGGSRDFETFPKYAQLKARMSPGLAAQRARTLTAHPVPQAESRVAYDPALEAVREEMALFRESLERTGAGDAFAETFVTAASPGIVSTTMLRAPDNAAYSDDREYLAELARELKPEYEYVAAQGHVLQIDAPDLALEREIMFADKPLSAFLERVGWHIEALNEALADIPADRVRLHVCWGNSDRPHCYDVELEPLLPLLYEAHVGAISMAGGNPRHQHDYKLFKAYPPPEGMVLIPGVIDVTYNYVEHPEVVADRICRYADAIGDPTRVIASTDCGFGTFAGYVLVAEDVAWRKLEVLVEGARRASERLWS